MKETRVFISYSHDSETHKRNVAGLSERLREDGICTILDSYVNGSPVEGWPRWMMNKMEESTHVLIVCTETYYLRFRGQDVPGRGKGVDWEGAIITQEFYDAKSRTNKFIPVLLGNSNDCHIPDPLRGQTYYRLDSNENYQLLYDAILGQSGIEPGPIGQQKPRARDVARPLRFTKDSEDSAGKTATNSIANHEVSGHIYSLMEVQSLIGRRDELQLLDDWGGAQQNSKFENVSVFVLNAIGGMGKSAILWHWLRNNPTEAEGRIWWSFYDEPSFDAFVVYSLHLMTRSSRAEVQAMFPEGKMAAYNQLLSELQTQRYLVSLDGLERILMAYSMRDAEYLTDEELESRVNRGTGSLQSRLPTGDRSNMMRRCVDPLVGDFLRRACQAMTSRIVVSTRLFPSDLESATGALRSGSFEKKLQGLSDEDAFTLWQAYGLTGSRAELVKLFRTFDNHPLLIRVLAAVVAKDRKNPGDFEKWRDANPNFNPFGLPIKQVQTHILKQALNGLSVEENQTLATLSCFRFPTGYEALTALLVRDGGPFCNAAQMIASLESLEDRGLLGWDRKNNRYDMHPVVRGVVWNLQDGNAKKHTCEQLIAFFDSAEIGRADLELITSVDQLSIPIEKVNLLLRMEKYTDASALWFSRLDGPFKYQICYARQYSAILEGFFPSGDPILANFNNAECIRLALAKAYLATAQPAKAFPLVLARAKECDCESCQLLVADTMCDLGKLSEADVLIRSQFSRSDTIAYTMLLNCWLDRGVDLERVYNLNDICRANIDVTEWTDKGSYLMFPAWFGWTFANFRIAILRKDFANAELLTERLMNGALAQNHQESIITSGVLQSEMCLRRGKIERARERADWSIAGARVHEHEKLELTALVQRAAIDVQCGEYESASSTLDVALQRLKEGPLPKLLSQAYLLEAKIQKSRGNRANAGESAIAAYTHAWCNGPPFAFQKELTAAEVMCNELGIEIPSLPSFQGDTTIPVIVRNTTQKNKDSTQLEALD